MTEQESTSRNLEEAMHKALLRLYALAGSVTPPGNFEAKMKEMEDLLAQGKAAEARDVLMNWLVAE